MVKNGFGCVPLRTKSPSPSSQTQGQAHSLPNLQKGKENAKVVLNVEYKSSDDLHDQIISLLSRTSITMALQPFMTFCGTHHPGPADGP